MQYEIFASTFYRVFKKTALAKTH